jgi:hypothetical protein|uniref:Uncharacterized protein n=1 Tax=Favella ehrenbergii TaxID=182087 RepID=A0A7S3HV36_9SPIT|mmetsp:Transcript_25860/g.34593  ORF Transcript_25860/g.34593 Transcript_25860/m.34593 type:complete len:153 (+) Transcript_25860:1168-1626(+)
MSLRYGSPEDANWVVGVDKIHHLISMCGGDLKKFESFYLLRRSNYGSQGSGSTSDITLSDFTDAVESYMNDANMDPYALVLYLFKMKFGEQENLIYVQDVKAFMQEFATYFQGDDLSKFVKDLELGLKLEGERVQVAQIAAMIKHSSEGFPK